MNVNDEFPLMTSDNVHGDTATQGFNSAVNVSLDKSLATDPRGTVGQRSTGADVLAGVDWDPETQKIQQPDVLDKPTGDAKADPERIRERLHYMGRDHESAGYVRIKAPDQAGAFGFYWNAPNGSLGGVQVFQILTQDPHRYRVKLHPWATSGTVGQLWIGSDPGNVQQAASGNVSLSAFPLDTGGPNANNISEFFWNDDMWCALDLAATANTYLFVAVERYTA